jgi:4-amino-4-deoxychorismate lyase
MALVNGLETNLVSINDRGLLYGDGLFETVLVHAAGPCLWRQHLDRLEQGAQRLAIPSPPRDLILGECARLASTEAPWVLKILLTRGGGGRGYLAPARPEPTRILMRYPAPDYPPAWQEHGVALRFCQTRLGENPRLAGIKHLNRLEQVLARGEWTDPQIAEGLMCDGRGRLIGGTMSNLFLVAGDVLVTPAINSCGIAGTVRSRVMEIAAEEGLQVREADIQRSDLEKADAAFLTNALIGVWPVRQFEHIPFDLGRLPGSLIERVRRAAFTPGGWRTG